MGMGAAARKNFRFELKLPGFFLVFFLLSGAGADQTVALDLLRDAERAALEKKYQISLEYYLKAFESFEKLDISVRRKLVDGLCLVCEKLLDNNDLGSALRGLVELGKQLDELGRIDASYQLRVRRDLEKASEKCLLEDAPHRAVAALETLVDDPDGSPSAWTLLVRAYTSIGRFSLAEKRLQTAGSRHPQHPGLYLAGATLTQTRATVAIGQADYRKAVAMLKSRADSLEQDIHKVPRQAELRLALGRVLALLWNCLQVAGDYPANLQTLQRAEEAFCEAARLMPGDPHPAFELGLLAYLAHDWVWAETWFDEALRRMQKDIRDNPELQITGMKKGDFGLVCRHYKASASYQRAVDAVNLGYFDRADWLIDRVLATMPEEVVGLKPWRASRQQAIETVLHRSTGLSKLDRIRRGDLLLRLHRVSNARVVFEKLMQAGESSGIKDVCEKRLMALASVVRPTVRAEYSAGRYRLTVEHPAGSADPALIFDSFQKAVAATSGLFLQKNQQTLFLRIYGNLGALLADMGPRLWSNRTIHFAHGIWAIHMDPDRGRSAWIAGFAQALARSHVERMSFAQAPLWLSEGLARMTRRTVDDRDSRGRDVYRRALCPWSRLDERLLRAWNDPEALEHLSMQSGHIVGWLIDHFGKERFQMLLVKLRQGQSLHRAVRAAFGFRIDRLERRWKLSVLLAPRE